MARGQGKLAAGAMSALLPALAVLSLLVTCLLGSMVALIAPTAAVHGSRPRLPGAWPGGAGLSVDRDPSLIRSDGETSLGEASLDTCKPELQDHTARLLESDPTGGTEDVTARRPGPAPRAHDTHKRWFGKTAGPGESASLVVCSDPAFASEVAAEPRAGRRADATPRMSRAFDVHAPRGPPSKLFS